MADVDALRLAAWRAVHTTATRVLDVISAELERETGMPLAWYETLLFVHENDPPILRQELPRVVALSQSGLSRMIAKIVAAGLLEQASAPDDKRSLQVQLTDAGRDALLRAAPVYHLLVQQHFGAWISDGEAEALAATLGKLPLSGQVHNEKRGELDQLVSFGESVLSLTSDSITVHDALVIRDALEPLVLLDASAHMNAEAIRELHATVVRMSTLIDDPTEFYRADWDMHRQIAALCSNSLLRDTYLQLLDVVSSRMRNVVPTSHLRGYLSERLAIHARLVDAMESGDEARVRDAAREHHFLRGAALFGSTDT